MRDTLSLGPTPCEESCEQLGPNYDERKARQECRTFIEQLRRVFGTEPAQARLRIKANAHDFGVYLDVEVVYDDATEGAVEYAFKLENETPARWDDIARAELGIALVD